MRTAFIKALWGDDSIPRFPKVWDDIARAQQHEFPVDADVLVFGKENHKRLAALGIAGDRLTHEPLVDWNQTKEQGSDPHRPFGVSIWRHKIEAMRRALLMYDAIVWLDWDCKLVKPLPADFWEQLAQGHPFRAALTKYRRLKCTQRSGRDARKYVPCGSWVYLRRSQDDPLGRLNVLARMFPGEYDEQLYSRYTDEVTGGWQGPEAYLAAGFEPPGVVVHRGVFRDDANALFYAPLRVRD